MPKPFSVNDWLDLKPAAGGQPEPFYRDSRHFQLREFACKGTGALCVSVRLLAMLDELRERFGQPLLVTSGYRSPGHNQRVGGAPDSQHLLGRAADLAPSNRDNLPLLRDLALELDFPGVGYYPARGFVHVDVRLGSPARWQG